MVAPKKAHGFFGRLFAKRYTNLHESYYIGDDVSDTNNVDSDFIGYSKVSTRQNPADYHTRRLSPIKYDRSLKEILLLYEKNGLAQRIVDTPVEAIEMAGFKFTANDERVQDFLDEWWNDPITGRSITFFRDVLDWMLMGEMITPVLVNPVNGAVEYGFVDPLNVKDVLKKEGNARVDDKVIVRNGMASADTVYEIIRKRQSVDLTGDCFYFAFKKPVNGVRGRPYLLSLIDGIDLHDDAMYNQLEKWAALTKYWFVVTMSNGRKEDFDEYKKNNFVNGEPPQSGQVLFQNDKVNTAILNPDFKASDSSTMAKLMRNNITGAAAQPAWMHGFGDDVNQGVAREQMRPFAWAMHSIQKQVLKILYFQAQFEVQNAIKYGRATNKGVMNQRVDPFFEVTPGEVFPKDVATNASAFVQIASVVSNMKLKGESKAIILSKSFSSLLDIDVNPDEFEYMDEDYSNDKGNSANRSNQDLSTEDEETQVDQPNMNISVVQHESLKAYKRGRNGYKKANR